MQQTQHKDNGKVCIVHQITNAQGCRAMNCTCRSNGTRWCCVYWGHHTCQFQDFVQCRWVVLHVPCSLSAGGLPGKSEKPLVQIIIEDAGHVCLFLPHFHCELNSIEMLWGYAKYRMCILCARGSAHLISDLQDTGTWLMGDLRLQEILSHSALIHVILSQSASFSEKLGDILIPTGK